MSSQVVSTTNDDEQRTAFIQAVGARSSAMEHLVPEMMFSTEESPGHGISAVKALALAAEEGRRIWTITAENLDLALENIDLSADAKTDIRNAVRTGKVVTAHESRINFHGWVGSGYIIMDPETGAGAYLISGGMSGGYYVGKNNAAIGIRTLLEKEGLSVDGGDAAIAVLGLTIAATGGGLLGYTGLAFTVGVGGLALGLACATTIVIAGASMMVIGGFLFGVSGAWWFRDQHKFSEV